jgi:thiol-disulfide isomerase/thioredoxin
VLIAAIGIPSFSQTGASQAGARNVASSHAELKGLPQVHLQDLGGKTVDAKSLRGSVYVFDFWATWCGPCLAEIPVWNKLQQKYAAQGLKIVGITMASGDADEVKPFVEKRDIKYTVLMGDDDQSYDLNIMGFPTTLVVTSDLKVFSTYVGSGPRKAAQVEADIQKILNSK